MVVVVVDFAILVAILFFSHALTIRDRKMRFSPLFRKIDVVIIPSKFEQNQQVQSPDIAQNLKSKNSLGYRFSITLSSFQTGVGKTA